MYSAKSLALIGLTLLILALAPSLVVIERVKVKVDSHCLRAVVAAYLQKQTAVSGRHLHLPVCHMIQVYYVISRSRYLHLQPFTALLHALLSLFLINNDNMFDRIRLTGVDAGP